MRNTIIIFLSVTIIAIALIGSLYIFDVQSLEDTLDAMVKVGGTLLLLGACSVAISFLVSRSKKYTHTIRNRTGLNAKRGSNVRLHLIYTSARNRVNEKEMK